MQSTCISLPAGLTPSFRQLVGTAIESYLRGINGMLSMYLADHEQVFLKNEGSYYYIKSTWSTRGEQPRPWDEQSIVSLVHSKLLLTMYS